MEPNNNYKIYQDTDSYLEEDISINKSHDKRTENNINNLNDSQSDKSDTKVISNSDQLFAYPEYNRNINESLDDQNYNYNPIQDFHISSNNLNNNDQYSNQSISESFQLIHPSHIRMVLENNQLNNQMDNNYSINQTDSQRLITSKFDEIFDIILYEIGHEK